MPRIAFLNFNYSHILTSRKDGRNIKHYLYNFIKILQFVG